ncbi:MAG: FAD-dependent oxidoreductase [Christensenellales bacterium]|jgi:glycine/D-amino acid oxidase-like deaminating enzyme/nitrite reductase/ring-hydroxylating ferredoxin subunit
MKNTSYWLDTTDAEQFPAFSGQRKCDVAVVGAGLTGITTALLLAKEGVDVVVLEADKAGTGTSGHTTAKITVQHALKYQDLAKDKAWAYARANSMGKALIAANINRYGISCDYAKVPAYVYTHDENQIKKIENEMIAYEEIGLKGQIVVETGLPFQIKSALMMEDQAQFHPLKYLYALIDVLKDTGCRIYEHSKVIDIGREEACVIQTENGTLRSDVVVLATNYPLIDIPGLFFIRLHQDRSYIISTNAKSVDIKGMYITAEQPVNSIRMHYTDKETLLLLGGYGHKTAKENDEKTSYSCLKDFLHTDFKDADASPTYGWSAQDCVTLDSMPYIGEVTNETPRVYIATGFEKWGMTNSAAAAMMIADEITGTRMMDVDVTKAFSPKRVAPGASAKNFFVQTGDVLKAFTAGNAGIPLGDYDDIEPGKGAVLRVSGQAQAIYKNKEGNVTAYKAHCTHMKCPLEYNEAENSFDCPCHGSRFSIDGKVLEGPAKKSLIRITEEED